MRNPACILRKRQFLQQKLAFFVYNHYDLNLILGTALFKLTIFAKLFLVLMLCMLMISGTILVSVHWSFKHGFDHYLLQAEAKQLDKLILNLQHAYAKEGSWQFLHDNRHAWFELLRQALDEQHLPPRFPFDGATEQANRPPPPPPPATNAIFPFLSANHPPAHPPHEHEHGPGPFGEHGPNILAKFLGSRLKLIDANKQFVVGIPYQQPIEVERPILQGDTTIGWVVVQSSDLMTNHLAELFVTQQIRNNAVIAGLSLLLAGLGSLLVTRKLLIPIKQITAGANALVKGEYGTQIQVHSNDELGQLAQNFNLLARTLLHNEQSRRQWIADISHELRTPLAVLRGEIEAVQDGVRALSTDNLKSLHAEVMSLNRLVDDLYELSLSDLNDSYYQKEPINGAAVLQAVITSQQARFQQHQLQLTLAPLPTKHITLFADARRLHQLFANICENSLRYTNPGGFCVVSVQLSSDKMHILFADSAPGVPDAALSKLFDRLYRVDPSRNRELGGAGLGLAICSAIVNAHHGSIQAAHSSHGGLAIEISLPRMLTL